LLNNFDIIPFDPIFCKVKMTAADNISQSTLIADCLSHTYPKASNPALSDFSLTLKTGEIVGLLGPNGAGKTTAISLMTGLMKPVSGSVHICGIDLFKHPRKARQQVGLVPQHIALYPNLTAAENLTYLGRMFRLQRNVLKQRVADCLETVGLSNTRDTRISAYSGGMKRRANLAAALLHQPRLLFLDEPTVGIDPQSRNMILDQLMDLGRSGTTMLYTTHYMEEAEKICSRVAIIDAGRIIAQGSPRELIDGHPGCHHLDELFLKLTGKELRDSV
jgi:ABC-2 type transport system ATP-binding protein